MRICHLSKYYPPAAGGIETYMRILSRAQADLGADVRVFCINHEPGPTTVEHDGPVAVTRFGRLVQVAKFDVCPDLARALAKVDADVLHLHVPNPVMVLALLRARPKAPIVVTYHTDLIRQRVLGSLFRPLERRLYRRVRLILATSPMYPHGSEFLRPYGDRIEILPMGIDLGPYREPTPETLAEAERIRGRYPGPIWLGCGRLNYYKGFVHAVRALPKVPGTLLIIGDGPERLAIESEADRLGVRDRLVMLGALPHYLDVVPYYHAAHAFWFPSCIRGEAFGLVQVEAMASGCPVINAAIPYSGVPWVSRHGESGLTVPINDPDALAAAANRLLEEPGLRDRLAEGARARAVREFDHRVMAERSLDAYRRVLAVGPARRRLVERLSFIG